MPDIPGAPSAAGLQQGVPQQRNAKAHQARSPNGHRDLLYGEHKTKRRSARSRPGAAAARRGTDSLALAAASAQDFPHGWAAAPALRIAGTHAAGDIHNPPDNKQGRQRWHVSRGSDVRQDASEQDAARSSKYLRDGIGAEEQLDYDILGVPLIPSTDDGHDGGQDGMSRLLSDKAVGEASSEQGFVSDVSEISDVEDAAAADAPSAAPQSLPAAEKEAHLPEGRRRSQRKGACKVQRAEEKAGADAAHVSDGCLESSQAIMNPSQQLAPRLEASSPLQQSPAARKHSRQETPSIAEGNVRSARKRGTAAPLSDASTILATSEAELPPRKRGRAARIVRGMSPVTGAEPEPAACEGVPQPSSAAVAAAESGRRPSGTGAGAKGRRGSANYGSRSAAAAAVAETEEVPLGCAVARAKKTSGSAAAAVSSEERRGEANGTGPSLAVAGEGKQKQRVDWDQYAENMARLAAEAEALLAGEDSDVD